MKFAFYTLGCKGNQYETQAMQQMLLADGHTLGEFDEICDGYIINTCTVTAVSDKKSRNAIRRVRRLRIFRHHHDRHVSVLPQSALRAATYRPSCTELFLPCIGLPHNAL